MFWWVLNAFLWSVANIFWKKSLSLSDIPERLFFAIGGLWGIVLSLGLIAFWKTTLPKETWLLLFPAVDAVVVAYSGLLGQRIYKEEKISALMPFDNLSSLLTIVAAFFILGNTPVATLAVAVATMVFIFVATFDFKSRHFPKNIKLILLSNGINASRSLAMGYALSHLASPTFYSVRNLLNAAVVLFPIFMIGEWKALRVSHRKYMVPRMAASFIGAISALIAFTLISKLWLVTTTLLGFLSMVSTLAFGYFYLGEKPEKKNVAIALTVAVFVTVWTYFKTV